MEEEDLAITATEGSGASMKDVRNTVHPPRQAPRKAFEALEESDLPTQLEIARQLLHLEQQLEAYQSLHEEDLAEMRRAISDIRKQLLKLLSVTTGLE